MKKWSKALLFCMGIITLALFITAIVLSPKKKIEGITTPEKMDFEQAITSFDFMSNTWETAVPQTEIHRLIEEHFASPLPEGKTEKKAIVIGYDGCRTDNFRLLENSEKSAVKTLLADGGQAVFSYCGGVNYPEKNVQATSTAPGWSSMLTGQWANTFGVTGNGQPKPIEPKTLLLELVEDKVIDKSAFYISWGGHFSNHNSTYINEKNYIEKNKINSVFLRAGSDEGTIENVLNDINTPDCSDFIFLTLEFTDHNGHATGFSLQNANYVKGFYDADATGKDFIDAIKSRPAYDTEDWLILITTDHGGIRRNHGGPSMEERITFIISNKEILK